MRLTGTNTLYLPRVSQMNYLMRDIVVNSTGVYTFSTTQFPPNSGIGTTTNLFQLSGNRILDASGQFVYTYNTGSSFSVSGWVDFPNGYRFLQIGKTLTRSAENVSGNAQIGSLNITCPTSGTMTCDVLLRSQPITTSISFNSFNIHGYASGFIATDTPMYVNGGTMQFYQSYEALLTGAPLVAYLDSVYQNPVAYIDNDTSYTNSSFQFDYHFNTSYNDVINTLDLARSGLYASGIYSLMLTSTGSGFQGLFDGVWSGSGFVFQKETNELILSYWASFFDPYGNPYPKAISYNFVFPDSYTYKKAEYVTGFRLTSSGEYLNPPVVETTGYYYVTGIQQPLDSFLFSTGCTGNLPILFSGVNPYGTGASGYLVLQTVQFSGVYSTGVKSWNIAVQYVGITGTGYTVAPIATVNTGRYGSQCFDVPNASGYSYAWFRPFRTSGTLDCQACYLTGVPLYTTGLVSGGLMTGIIVTGIDVYNIGSGYSLALAPLMRFRRTGEIGLTGNASGLFLMHTGTYYSIGDWTIYTGTANTSLKRANTNGTVNLGMFDNQFTFKVAHSGDFTIPLTGGITVTMAGAVNVATAFVYNKYFDTDPYALKKKSDLVVYPKTSELGFGTTQEELDTLYSDAGYTNNSWPFVEGDYDF